MTWSLSLLGPLIVRVHPDQPVTLTSKKAQALLAYLAVESARPHSREALAGLLWPDYAARAARSSLRQAVQIVRLAAGDERTPVPLFLLTRETIQLNPEVDTWLDVAEFDKGVARIAGSPASPSRQGGATIAEPGAPSPGRTGPQGQVASSDVEVLRAAVALYRGPFLEGFSLGGGAHADSPAFGEWLLLHREHYHRQASRALAALSALYEAGGAYDEALACAQRTLAMEPWQEEAHQQAMRLLALMGRRTEALAQYRRCREVLLRELGTEPGAETIALYEQIRDRMVPGTYRHASPAHEDSAIAPGLAAAEREESPLLVAREEELARLNALLAEAAQGQGRVVLVTGEAGSGKTALMEGFARQAMAAHGDLLVTVGRCSAQGGAGDAYEPFVEALRILTGDPQGTLGARHARRLGSTLPLILDTLAQHVPDLLRILARDPALVERARAASGSAPARGAARTNRLAAVFAAAPAQAPGSAPSAAIQQGALGEQMTRALRAIAERQPLLILLDDLQWADLASLDMLFHLGRHLQGARILVVATYRSHDLAFSSPWLLSAGRGGRPEAAETGRPAHALASIADEFQRLWGDVRIDLDQAHPKPFIDAYLDSWPNLLGARFRQTLLGHTGGNALFVVELLHAMQDRGNLLRGTQGHWVEGPNLDWDKLPPRVEGAISYRIGQLAPAQQEMLEVASVEGEQFHAEVLAHVLGHPLQEVVSTLSGSLGRQARLVMLHGLVRVGGRELARYRFRHGMFQRYLYERLDEATRAQLHGAVGAAIEALYAEEAWRLATDLARHYEEAGQVAKSARYLLDAGRHAAELGAHREAIASYEHALALLPGGPPDAASVELELSLYAALDFSLQCAEGWGSPKRLQTVARAYELGRQTGWSTPTTLYWLKRVLDLHGIRGEYARVIELAQELLDAAEHLGDLFHIAAALVALSYQHVLRGNLAQALEHITRALAIDLETRGQVDAERVANLALQREMVASGILWPLGYTERARRHMERALATREGVLSPESAVYLHGTAGTMYAQAWMDDLARGEGETLLRIAAGRDLPEMEAWANVVVGWAEARAGEVRGVERARAALQAQQSRGTLLGRYLQAALLAEAHLAAGQAQQALEVIDEALEDLERTGTHYGESTLWTLRGEALERGGVASETALGTRQASPEACLERAIAVARGQGARLWELRALTQLLRWQQQHGRAQEAREPLAALYATFDEGLDAPDLVEARAVLTDVAGWDRGGDCAA